MLDVRFWHKKDSDRSRILAKSYTPYSLIPSPDGIVKLGHRFAILRGTSRHNMQANCTELHPKRNPMATSDEFKAQLKAGKIVDALTLALGEAVELEITTWVASSSDGKTSAEADKPAADRRMRTRMNIVDGAIDNEVGTQFIGNGPYTELRQFHMEQVQQGRQIIQQNLENLQQLFTVLTSTLTQLPQASHRLAEGNSALSPSNEENLQ